MKVNWDEVPDSQSYIVPAGTYKMKVEEVSEQYTDNGVEFWTLQLKVVHGPQQGKVVFDRIFFSQRALPRVKHVCKELGLSVKGEIELKPQMLVGRTAMVKVTETTYTDRNGNEKPKNDVPFDGYESCEGVTPPKSVVPDDGPPDDYYDNQEPITDEPPF